MDGWLADYSIARRAFGSPKHTTMGTRDGDVDCWCIVANNRSRSSRSRKLSNAKVYFIFSYDTIAASFVSELGLSAQQYEYRSEIDQGYSTRRLGDSWGHCHQPLNL